MGLGSTTLPKLPNPLPPLGFTPNASYEMDSYGSMDWRTF